MAEDRDGLQAPRRGAVLDCGGRRLDLSRPRVMGILNVTPDSFSDGGLWAAPEAALAHARAMVAAGADLIDVGGESTRPGAQPVDAQAEIRRVVPIVEALAGELPVPISIDTSKPQVMVAAAAAGAGMLNDVRALRDPGALETAARLGLPVCLMHMEGEPRTMQRAPVYGDVVAEVRGFLAARVAACVGAGIPRERLLVDPGFGFGKDLGHNLALLARLGELAELGIPLLVGVSRKSMLGAIAGREVGGRLAAGLAAAVLAAERGAAILRVHDVAETVDALKVWVAVRGAAGS
jgi:dihydropteroate synthase